MFQLKILTRLVETRIFTNQILNSVKIVFTLPAFADLDIVEQKQQKMSLVKFSKIPFFHSSFPISSITKVNIKQITLHNTYITFVNYL